jgi:hypothetical protein
MISNGAGGTEPIRTERGDRTKYAGFSDLHLSPKEEWRTRALCKVTGPNDDLWFSDSRFDRIKAAGICAECPVNDECYTSARRRNERWGIFGGIDFDGKHARQPDRCSNGHLMAEDMYVRRGREIVCGVCARENWVDYNRRRRPPVREAANRKARNDRDRARRAVEREAALKRGELTTACANCGEGFVKRQHNQMFCKRGCKRDWYRKRRTAA